MSHSMATLSNNAVVSASIVFSLALLAHIAEWARARQVSAVPETAHAWALAGADRSEPLSSPGAASFGADALADEEASDRFGRIGLALTVLGVLVLAVGVVARGMAAHRVPWGSMYEFTITCSLAAITVYLILVRRFSIRWLGIFVTGFATLVLGIAVLVLYRPVEPLVPALHSYWLMIHVSAAAIGGGAFTVGALTSVLYLLRRRFDERTGGEASAAPSGFLARTPSAEAIDRIAYRVHAFAFPVWTFAVLCGAIWAQYAWGRFWGWDPKEVWAFITWVAYAAYLHARATAGWQGKAAAYVALAGYATFLFNFVGINLFGSGLHSYAGM